MKNLNNYRYLILLGFVIIAFYLYQNNPFDNQNPSPASNTESSFFDDMPVLKMPVSYFASSSTAWGSSDGNDGWTEVTIDEGSVSYPTTTISIKGFDTKTKNLPKIKSEAEINRICNDGMHDCFTDLNKTQVNEYGDLATRFLPNDFITAVNYFDVDSDSKNETVVSTCGVGGNHCPHKIIIIKDNKVIFSVSEGVPNLNLVKYKNGNGFLVEWVPERLVQSMCCSLGYMRTRFVYENKIFKPVYEQEVRYFKVENTEANF